MRPDLFGIYVHWPFCKSKCPYCDFNSHVADTLDHEAWANAYEKEIQYYAALTPDKIVTSIFFGGGTPSLMKPETVRRVIDSVQKNWRISNDIEITLEANPTSVEAEKFKAFKDVGVNRVSLGVQSLRDDDLKFLGREHTAKEALAAVDIARSVFDRYSFDLMYARPNQSVSDWEKELKDALKYIGGHSSLYQLTIEPNTPFKVQHDRGDFMIPDNDTGGAFYEVTQDIMGAHGLSAYEVSNHAKEGQECLHNLAYWRYADYVGVGPGAHGRLTLNNQKIATRAHRAPDIWLKRASEHSHGAHPFENISEEQAFQERVMMGLRLREGIEIAGHLDDKKISRLIDEGFLERHEKTLRPTQSGMQRLNGILQYLL